MSNHPDTIIDRGQVYHRTDEIYVEREMVRRGRGNLMVGALFMSLSVMLFYLFRLFGMRAEASHLCVIGIPAACLVIGFFVTLYGLYKILYLARGPLYIGESESLEAFPYPRRIP